MRDHDCVAFLQWALPRLGMRWAGFRKVRRQVCRRVERHSREQGFEDLDAYRQHLAQSPAEWGVLDSLCRVTISRFFRDRAVFAALGDLVLPELAARARAAGRRRVAVWSAGCASGEEPYSVSIVWAMTVARSQREPGLEVVATDADSHLLERARRAVYPAGSVRGVPPEWRRLTFDDRDGHFALRSPLVEPVVLLRQDLRQAAPQGPFDLVLCRNLAFTYYAEKQQREVGLRLSRVLRPGGVLVVGSHEVPPPECGFEPMSGAPSCHRVPEPGAP